MDINKEINSLQKIGLSVPEARVYLALSELKESKTGKIIEKSKVASSKIYKVLDKLIEKGLVSYRLQNNIKIFIASTPVKLKDLFEEKEKSIKKEKNEILNLIENLKLKQQIEKPYSKYKYYEGISGIKSIWLEIIENFNEVKKPMLIYGGKKESYEVLLGFYNEFQKQRIKHNIKLKIIQSNEERNTSKRKKEENTEVKFTKLNNESEWSIIGNKLIINHYMSSKQKIPRGFIIEDEIFVETFRQVFNQIWENL